MNDTISDKIFTVKGGRSAFEDAKLRQARLEYEKIKPKPLPRRDPEGIKQDIDRKLAEADRQEKQLEASSAAREDVFWTPVKQLSFAAFGVVVLLSALALKRRSG